MNDRLAFERAARKLRQLIDILQNNVDRIDGKKPYTFSIDFDFGEWLNSVIYCIDSIDENWRGSTLSLLDWLSEHPDTADRLSTIKTPEGIELATREPPTSQGGYTIKQLTKEWAAYIFWLNSNTGELLNNDKKLACIRSFVDFLLTPHEILYADDRIYDVRLFNDERSEG